MTGTTQLRTAASRSRRGQGPERGHDEQPPQGYLPRVSGDDLAQPRGQAAPPALAAPRTLTAAGTAGCGPQLSCAGHDKPPRWEPSSWMGAVEAEQFRSGVDDGAGQCQRRELIGRDSGLVEQARPGGPCGAGVS